MLRRGNKNALKARMVWEDASDAYIELQRAANRTIFRRRWVAAITLLRAIGNVLIEADSKLHPELGGEIDSFKEESKDFPLYVDFIKGARDMTVKQYQSQLFGRWDTSSPLSIEPVRDDELTGIELVFRGGKLDGQALDKLFPEALNWWDTELRAIEDRLGEISPEKMRSA